MDDVLGYSGRRCIVTGAASGIGAAAARILVDLGAEVHVIDTRKPDISALASYSETDLRDPEAIARTVDAIGAVVNNLFNCVDLGDWRDLFERVVPLMIEGAAITSVASGRSKEAIDAYAATQYDDLAVQGIRINTVSPGPTGSRPEEQAWPLILFGSPRASAVTGASLDSGHRGGSR
jgi:NAD(P)-dependent dehydrogenase (short-subunit alcohol dehydrogenase family)